MKAIRTQLASLTLLEKVLPRLLSNLSLARAQIAIDQIRAMISANSTDKIVFVTATDADSRDQPVAAAIAIQQSGGASGESCDMASLIHAGLLQDAGAATTKQIVTALSSALDRELHQRGVRFVQWATDVCDAKHQGTSQWCSGFGYQQVGTLDYMGGDVPPDQEDADGAERAAGGLTFSAVDWDQPDAFDKFAGLVEQTYLQTLDCPKLADYRTACETLRGYITSAAYDPRLWFFVQVEDAHAEDLEQGSDQDGVHEVGCLVLGNHRPLPGSAGNDQEASSVIEIVYMGLIPAARRSGRGIEFMKQAFAAGRNLGAKRIILAVDQNNQPALAIYRRVGLEPMLSETVWVKRLDSGNLLADEKRN